MLLMGDHGLPCIKDLKFRVYHYYKCNDMLNTATGI